jgi:hypothetical protein
MPEETEYGDRAGEDLRIQRGRYHAGLHVGLGFIVVAGVFWAPLCYGTLAIVESKMPSTFSDPFQHNDIVQGIGTGAALVGVLIAAWIFYDRWRCIEATASRYCSGVMNLSLFYVPVIVAVYALARGARKLFGR